MITIDTMLNYRTMYPLLTQCPTINTRAFFVFHSQYKDELLHRDSILTFITSTFKIKPFINIHFNISSNLWTE